MTKNGIIQLIELALPEFCKAVRNAESDTIILNQLSFSESELELLGSVIKYAGYFKKTVTIIS
jgi:hypothetical protein